ncbi:hypothetical protein OCT63_17180 [Vibrio sp. RW]|uniref:hypothetical protein n=1 Tax=Vibrio sp. RW TaxID=2998833 RepID=UPI0022CD7846|nr:hypothetical protein [Vibrio sp. RW]MDA0145961.1 hypothetical protein [Vibrio sp. RW]
MKNNRVNALSKTAIKSLAKQLDQSTKLDVEGCEALAIAVLQGKIKVEAHSDTFWRYEDLAGDVFCPKVNHDRCPEQLKREERNFKARIRRAGVFFVEASYWTGREWESQTGIQDNVICGFVGNDFIGSGYEFQMLQSALDAYNAQSLDGDGFVIDPMRDNGTDEVAA